MTIINRSALIAWGRQNIPADLAYIQIDHGRDSRQVVTWRDVMENRRKKQNERLRLIRHVNQWRACKLWVAYFDQWLMGGWHAFIDSYRGDERHLWTRRGNFITRGLMVEFPLVLPLGDEAQSFEAWKIEFAKRYQRGTHDGKPRGVAYVWWNGHDYPKLAVSSEALPLEVAS